MVDLDNDARIAVERSIDTMIKDAKNIDENYKGILIAQGIEPNLETLLSFINGFIFGIVNGIYLLKYKRVLISEETIELVNLLKRRGWELRQAIVDPRISLD